jgi:hypothetical protein
MAEKHGAVPIFKLFFLKLILESFVDAYQCERRFSGLLNTKIIRAHRYQSAGRHFNDAHDPLDGEPTRI